MLVPRTLVVDGPTASHTIFLYFEILCFNIEYCLQICQKTIFQVARSEVVYNALKFFQKMQSVVLQWLSGGPPAVIAIHSQRWPHKCIKYPITLLAVGQY